METKAKQIKLETAMQTVQLADLIQDLCAKHGQGKLADSIGMDPGSFSNFKNGTGNISLKNLSALMEFSEMVIIPEKEMKNIMLALLTVTKQWGKAVGL